MGSEVADSWLLWIIQWQKMNFGDMLKHLVFFVVCVNELFVVNEHEKFVFHPLADLSFRLASTSLLIVALAEVEVSQLRRVGVHRPE